MIMSSTKGSAESHTGSNRFSSILWKAALPVVTLMGITFHCRGPRRVLMAEQARDCSEERHLVIPRFTSITVKILCWNCLPSMSSMRGSA